MAHAPERFIENPSFSQWLFFQRDRQDKVGILARWVDDDRKDGKSCWPHIANTAAHMIMHIKREHRTEKHAPEEIVIREALAEFRNFIAEGGQVRSRLGGYGRRISTRKPHRGYSLSEETITHIQEIAQWSGTSQSDVIERLVKAERTRLLHSET